MGARLRFTILAVLLLACGGGSPLQPREPVAAPTDNPGSEAKVQLGRHLFYDTRLSINGSRACGTCHEQRKAFTDGFARAIGATLQVHSLSSPTLTNVVFRAQLNWRNPLPVSLEQQLLTPLFGTHPIEMGMAGHEEELLARLAPDPQYQQLFAAAFPADPSITLPHLAQAIAWFERTIVSDDNAYDRFLAGNTGALSDTATAGMKLFFNEAGCGQCHSGPDLDRDALGLAGFHNIGLYNLDGAGAYPKAAQGMIELTGQAADMGRFRTPTLRNIAMTAPYFHDGSTASLNETIRIHLAGGRNVSEGPRAGMGTQSPLRSPSLIPRTLSDAQVWAVEVFLRSLTDDAFITNPTLANPWPQP